MKNGLRPLERRKEKLHAQPWVQSLCRKKSHRVQRVVSSGCGARPWRPRSGSLCYTRSPSTASVVKRANCETSSSARPL